MFASIWFVHGIRFVCVHYLCNSANGVTPIKKYASFLKRKIRTFAITY